MTAAVELKNEGNERFKAGDMDGALSCYSRALSLVSIDDNNYTALLKNRAAVFLQQNKYDDVVRDCTAVLERCECEPKALYRRCLAREKLGLSREAYQDAAALLVADPKNKDIQPVMARLHAVVQKEMEESNRVSGRVRLVCQYVFESASEHQKRVDSASNMLVLAKESAGAKALLNENVHTKIRDLLKVENDADIVLSCIRTLAQLCCVTAEMTVSVVAALGVAWLLELLNSMCSERVAAGQYLLQCVFNTLANIKHSQSSHNIAGVNDLPAGDPASIQQHRREIDSVMSVLSSSVNSRSLSPLAREAVIELILRNCTFKTLNWSCNLVKIGGIQRLLEVASEYEMVGGEKGAGECSLLVNGSTRTTVAVCLSTLYDDMPHDDARQQFYDAVEDFIKSKLITPEIEGKIRVVCAITVLMQGPIDVGNKMLAREGMLEMMLVMANSPDIVQQRVACEALIAVANKKDKCKSIIGHGVAILKRLYQSEDDAIRVRALVGLCKIGSVGGTDALVRPFSDGSALKLATACRRFLVNPSKDHELRRWATEGLSYLTLDAEVKEKLIEDKVALHAMLDLAKTGDHSVVYGVITTLVNLTNSYDKQEVMPEMLELAKFAKQHIPEQHELDDEDFVNKRIEVLAREGAPSALVALSKTDSRNCRELIARVFNAMCARENLRGLVVQQGGARALLALAQQPATQRGLIQAAQALSRIGITIDPATAFPGQRCCEVVRPLLSLLHPDCSALENFEALMALCNLCGMNDTVRQRVMKEKGVSLIEQYMYEDHVMLRRAATQCVTNLVACADYVKLLEGNNDRLKFLVLLVAEEDGDTALAAAGSLAMATQVSSACCRKVLDVKSWHEMMCVMLASDVQQMRLRGVVTVANMLSVGGKQVGACISSTDLLQIITAISRLPPETETTRKIIATAEQALKQAREYGLLRRPDDSSDDEL